MKILSYVIVGLLGLSFVGESFAAKIYRYIKREHGVRFQGTLSMSFEQGFKLNANLSGAYVLNYKGKLESGPYFDFTLENFKLTDWSAGFLVEHNFIENRGASSWIPSLGFTVGAVGYSQFDLGLHTSLKRFVAKRTAFITTLGYNLHTPFNNFFTYKSHNADIRTGLSYYFDFY